MNNQPLNISLLGSVSKQFANAIFEVFPQLQAHAQMFQSKEADGFSLRKTIASPTRDHNRLIDVWVDEVVSPSLGFGPSHVHESADEAGMKTLAETLTAIMSDRLVIREDIGGKYPGHSDWIDLREPQALVNELTGEFSPGKVLLKSWSGKGDRQVSLSDLKL